MTTKEKVLKSIQELPKDVSIDQIMERIYLIHKIEKGINQVESGKITTHKEANKRMKKWLE